MTTVIVLNASYERLHQVSFKHAVRMLFREVAVVEEAEKDRMIGPHPWPKVVRLVRYVVTSWMHRPAVYGRTSVLRRDHYRCGYCGRSGHTLDHVLPLSRGGTSTWLNTVTACGPCNGRKANRTPPEAGMVLLFEPWVPTRAQIAG